MLEVGFAASAERRHVIRQLREVAYRDLRTELRKAQRDAVRPLRQEIAVEAVATLPTGYGPVLANHVRATALGATGDPVVRVRIFARGRKQLRDIRAVNLGVLRHPLFGNRRFWYNTRVRPGFVTRPVDRLADEVVDESLQALDRIVAKVTKG